MTAGLVSRWLQFVTAVYVFVDAESNLMRYGAAGHPPALLVSRDGHVDEISENGIMLGQFPHWTYTWVERAFRAGDRLILHTDGLIEATDARGDFFDPQRLRAFALSGLAADTSGFVDTVIRHVSLWSGRTRTRGFDDASRSSLSIARKAMYL